MEDALVAAVKSFEVYCPSGRAVLCGVSGGADSVMLARALKTAGFERAIVCHFNHRTRGRESDADERFVRRLASELGFDFERGESAAGARGGGEAVWRRERYEFFAETARRRRCGALFLGHNADDQVETVLWNLFRGAGRRGMAGMRLASRREGMLVLRPFLDVPRSEIEAAARSAGVEFRTDATNKDVRFSRNAIRHVIIPAIERSLGRNIRGPLLKTARILAEEERFLEQMTEEALEDCRLEALVLDVRRVARLAPALQRRVVEAWLSAVCGSSVGFDHVESVRALVCEPGRPRRGMAAVNLPGGLRARRRAGRLFVEGGAMRKGEKKQRLIDAEGEGGK